jgi:hypothetical protein
VSTHLVIRPGPHLGMQNPTGYTYKFLHQHPAIPDRLIEKFRKMDWKVHSWTWARKEIQAGQCLDQPDQCETTGQWLKICDGHHQETGGKEVFPPSWYGMWDELWMRWRHLVVPEECVWDHVPGCHWPQCTTAQWRSKSTTSCPFAHGSKDYMNPGQLARLRWWPTSERVQPWNHQAKIYVPVLGSHGSAHSVFKFTVWCICTPNKVKTHHFILQKGWH